MSTQSHESRKFWLEAAAALILALASLLAAWSTFEAAQWTRQQAITANATVAKLLESTKMSTLGGQDTLIDVVTFSNWLEAISSEDQRLADFYRSRFRDEFKPAFEAWLGSKPLENPDAPPSPFAMTEYTPARRLEAVRLQDEAGELQQQGREAADNAELYVRNTLFLASALFFVGISRMFANSTIRLVILGMSVVLLIFGAFTALTAPIA